MFGAVGRTANGGPLLDSFDWLAGVRAGLNLAIRAGLLRPEYGRASGGHRGHFRQSGTRVVAALLESPVVFSP